MGIHPIDLQTMYSQIGNIAKTVASQQQGIPLSQAMREASIVRQNSELASQVHRAADNETKSGLISDEGHNSSADQESGGDKKKSEDKDKKKEQEFRESYLGVHIDITR